MTCWESSNGFWTPWAEQSHGQLVVDCGLQSSPGDRCQREKCWSHCKRHFKSDFFFGTNTHLKKLNSITVLKMQTIFMGLEHRQMFGLKWHSPHKSPGGYLTVWLLPSRILCGLMGGDSHGTGGRIVTWGMATRKMSFLNRAIWEWLERMFVALLFI